MLCPEVVLSRQGPCKMSGSKSNLLDTKGVTKDNVDPGSNNAYTGKKRQASYQWKHRLTSPASLYL